MYAPPTTNTTAHPPDLGTLPDDALLDDGITSELLDLKPGTLAVWRCTGRYGLPFVKVGRKVRYRAGDLREWLASRAR